MKHRQFVVCEVLEDRRLLSVTPQIFPFGDHREYGELYVLDSRPKIKRNTIVQIDSVSGRFNTYVKDTNFHTISITIVHGLKEDRIRLQIDRSLVMVASLTKLISVNIFGGAHGDNIRVMGKGKFKSLTPINLYAGGGNNTFKNNSTFSTFHYIEGVPIEVPINPRHVF